MSAGLHEGLHIGRFELVHRIGEGGFGTVWVAKEDGASRLCALRAVKGSPKDPLGTQMLLTDARTASRVVHPNVAAILAVGHWDGGPFVVTELVDGESLATLIRRVGTPFAPELVVRMGRDLAAALHAAHELSDDSGKPIRLVHRAVSPQNVLLSVTGHAKIVDLGLSLARDRFRELGATEGNDRLAFMSPEQVRGDVDRRSDIWALGAVLYRLLAGCAPFECASEAATVTTLMGTTAAPPLPPTVPPALAGVIARAVARRPEDRYATAELLGEALAQATRNGVGDIPHAAVGNFVAQYSGKGTTELPARALADTLVPSSSNKGDAALRSDDIATMPPPPGVPRSSDDESTRAVSMKDLLAQIGLELPPMTNAESTRVGSPLTLPEDSTRVGSSLTALNENPTTVRPSAPVVLAPTMVSRSSPPPKKPIVDHGPKAELTQVAGAAIELAVFFNLAFKQGIDGPWPCKVELTAPQGQSTGGGKQALQHIRLVPDDGSPTLVIGSVNKPGLKVELRTFAYTANMYNVRMKGKAFPIDEPRFSALIQRLYNFFTSQRFDVQRADTATGEFVSHARAAEPKRNALAMAGMIMALLVVAIAAGVATTFIISRSGAPKTAPASVTP